MGEHTTISHYYVVHVVIISNLFAAGISHRPITLSGYIKRRASNGRLIPRVGIYIFCSQIRKGSCFGF
ncbi:hypothetical protein K445DRAFT_313232 [Daldinia sp. EC12]|nr:hypothetical protein K445DRAFT_313232 [Daldinia sp. EC12]